MPRLVSRIVLLTALVAGAGSYGFPQSDISSTDSEPTFREHVNVVTVRVVVRDKAGQAVGNLQQNDFVLFDSGKRQVIQRFSVEGSSGTPAASDRTDPNPAPASETGLEAPTAKIAERYTAFLFDDQNMDTAQMMEVRQAVNRVINPDAKVRIAVYTTSGHSALEFTDDLAKVREFIEGLKANPASPNSMDCPRPSELTFYVAKQIQGGDPSLQNMMISETMACLDLSPSTPGAQQIAKSTLDGAVSRTMAEDETRARNILSMMNTLVRRMSVLPGQRMLLLLSPGWYAPEMEMDIDSILDRAGRAGVVINTLQSRGLYTPSEFDASNDTLAPPMLQSTVRSGELVEEGLLGVFSSGTGGISIQNRNDFESAIRQLTEPARFSYLLAFAPDSLKPNGRFHKLKVQLTNSRNYTVQSRLGYYAPAKSADAAQQAKDDIESAVFSQTVMNEIPVSLHSEFFKTGDYDAKLAVLAHVDLRAVRFSKESGRNVNQLTVVASLFDENGNYVTGMRKTIDMHIRDETLPARIASGITVRNSFPVKTGTYAVRLVVRDREGRMSASNAAVQIP